MRPIKKGEHPVDEDGNKIEFKEYKQSRRFLIDRLGRYCSYCENSINANLAVEHILPKEHYPHLELSWSNFLLACTNCNSTKGQKVFNKNDYIFPDTDHSFFYFKYDYSGIVQPSENLNSTQKKHSKNTISLVGLDKLPHKKYSTDWKVASDSRFEKRLESYNNAIKYKNIYTTAKEDSKHLFIPFIIDIIKGSGFWSIWMHIFSDVKEVRDAILYAFPGTNTSYFIKYN